MALSEGGSQPASLLTVKESRGFLLLKLFLGLGCKLLSVEENSAELSLHGYSGSVATGCCLQHLGSLTKTLHESFTLEIIVTPIKQQISQSLTTHHNL